MTSKLEDKTRQLEILRRMLEMLANDDLIDPRIANVARVTLEAWNEPGDKK